MSMAQTRPGTYILYKELGPGQPVWPGIVFVDELAPGDVQHRRPPGYVTLVLLLTEPLQFEWATTNQLSPLVSIEQSNIAPQSDEQRQVWTTASFLQDAGAGLEYWRHELSKQLEREPQKVPDLDQYSDHLLEEFVDDDEEKDEQLREALRISLEACAKTSILSTPSSSPPEKHWSGRTPQNAITLDSDDDSLYSRPRRGESRLSPKRIRRSRHREDDDDETSWANVRKHTRDEGCSITHRKPDMNTQQKRQGASFSGLDQLLGQSSLGQRSSALMSDVIEGDISESKDFVQIPVGADRDIRTFQMKDVWDRSYFRDSRAGTNHFDLNKDGMWELRHPQLVNINIEDFQFIAEFLTDDGFGLRQPETHEQMKEAIAQCVSAWATAEKLNMDDMLEHIAEKVKFLEWDHEDVLTLSILVYRAPSPSLDAHNTMRDWISSYLSHHFWSYIKDEAIGHFFRKRLRMLPELERDVFAKRAQSLTTDADPDEDEESDEEALGDDSDL